MGRKEPHSAGSKISIPVDFSLTDPSEISNMRSQLIKDLKKPFIDHVTTATSYNFIKQVKIENFDERVMTLPDKEIFELYTDYLKIRSEKNVGKKETEQNGILKRIEQRILTDGSFLRRIFKNKKS